MAVWAGSTLALDDYTLTQPKRWAGATLALDDNTKKTINRWAGATIALDDHALNNMVAKTWHGAALALDDDVIPQGNPTKLKVWDGSAWVAQPYYVWDGSGWKQIS